MARVVSRPAEPEGRALSQPWDGLLVATLVAAWLGTGLVIVATIAFLSAWDATFCADAAWCDDFSAAGPTVFLVVSAATLTAN